ncbi:37S ribosomal protein S24, mitochondrial [Purpureocillium takamizusanense]|uniref:37S ribosomal protein S24, mitochondrial n=1 Tax=Purpureocillium takamizusanense TaxID=2060973 RepID=A0A9Q8QJ07_9HYPO|nr:37S ribosomal protein S24, mitochondrial [Purpureocillium takamizusanense]UNI20693.1 37S ribosomal protein S24, mitochondrial [Purpureocillium takamizusanense]
MPLAPGAVRLCMVACRRSAQLQKLPRLQQFGRQRIVSHRAFRTMPARRARERAGMGRQEEEEEEDEEEDEEQEEEEEYDVKEDEPLEIKMLREDPEVIKVLDGLDAAAEKNGYFTFDDFVNAHAPPESTLEESELEAKALDDELLKDDRGDRPNQSSFWYDEDDPETDTEEHDEFDEDDITSMAHGKLEEVREMRHYARLAVWEMPLLAKFAKPFAPPKDGEVLRWRYTTYMGESHPAEKKVVVQFAPDDLNLTPVQTDKLKKLVGPRYNPETELVKMSCESFEHQAQNKRYLSNLVDDLIAAAKDPKDTFEDVPLDLRHHQIKAKPRFPKEWLLTDERRLQIDEQRHRAALEDKTRAEGGLLVDGKKVIDGYLKERLAEEQEKQKVAELVAAAPKGGKSWGGANRARR